MYEITITIDGKRESLSEIGYAVDAYTGIFLYAELDNFSGFAAVDDYRLRLTFTKYSRDYPMLCEIEAMLLKDDQAGVLVERVK